MPRHLLLLTLLATCAAKGRNQLSPPVLVTEATHKGLEDRTEAIGMLEQYLAGRPDPAVAPWAMVWAGEQRRLAGDLKAARTWFAKAQRAYPDHPLQGAATLGIALVDARTALSGNTLATLQLVSDTGIPDSMNADRYRIVARIAADEGTPGPKVRALVSKAVHFAQGDPDVEARVMGDLGDLLESTQAQTLNNQPSAWDADRLSTSRVESALEQRDWPEAIRRG
ncbi:MAG: hypothetical protein QGG40_22110, partial [Myxococcota bacterium]|nr:hypothetical protein [Myxococcota bacterium]